MDSPFRKRLLEAFKQADTNELIDSVKIRRVRTEALHMIGTTVQLFDRQPAVQQLIQTAAVTVQGPMATLTFGKTEGKKKAVTLVISMDDQGPAYRVSGKKEVNTRTQETAFTALTSELVDHAR